MEKSYIDFGLALLGDDPPAWFYSKTISLLAVIVDSTQIMAEVVGITGTTAGLVSLGIQVYTGLKSYLDHLRSRDQRVAKVLQYLECLRQSLDVVQNALSWYHSEHATPQDNVKLSLQLCEHELTTLHVELQKHIPLPADNVKGRLRETGKKLRYPLNTPVLEELISHLDRANALLAIAIHGLDL
jgi:hypothetical protein